MCTAFGTWQFINNTKRDPKIVRAEKKKGRVHLAWICKLHLKQMSEGRLFLHDHPANATSWHESCILEPVRQYPGLIGSVARVVPDVKHDDPIGHNSQRHEEGTS